MPPDELELLTLAEELSDAELEAIVAGKGYPYGGYYGNSRYYGNFGRLFRGSYIGAGGFRGFRGFGSSLGSIGRGFAHAGRR